MRNEKEQHCENWWKYNEISIECHARSSHSNRNWMGKPPSHLVITWSLVLVLFILGTRAQNDSFHVCSDWIIDVMCNVMNIYDVYFFSLNIVLLVTFSFYKSVLAFGLGDFYLADVCLFSIRFFSLTHTYDMHMFENQPPIIFKCNFFFPCTHSHTGTHSHGLRFISVRSDDTVSGDHTIWTQFTLVIQFEWMMTMIGHFPIN